MHANGIDGKINRDRSFVFSLCFLMIAFVPGSLRAKSKPELRPDIVAIELDSLNVVQKELFDRFTERLREYPDFGAGTRSSGLPEWETMNQNEPALRKLADNYRLDQVAGNGPELQKMINLMEWAHSTLFYVNAVSNPDTLNADAIIRYARTQNCEVNCRMKSIVLNEALLSLGFFSRRISGLPSQFDGDTHSIVTVWSDTYDKWICLDPTFNTYFMDVSGKPMGILEVRDLYRSGQIPGFRSICIPKKWALKLSGVNFETYDLWYAVYMAKNCFRFSCPPVSAYNYESSENQIRLNLNPSGYESDGSLNTDDADFFFRKPGTSKTSISMLH